MFILVNYPINYIISTLFTLVTEDTFTHINYATTYSNSIILCIVLHISQEYAILIFKKLIFYKE
ncbi:putative membrane protein [Candidatus Neoehrlichia lotoris str. RAC413]|uniref:Putative membrane protein n=1 Tax=Candidatus Neoehrlichia procyonis str. RAC413 TaxID=1359163 RepID=A0A0F3NLL9_9RICK|nr:putative membrane protein [Candidatus Neoehrlichia lotoris str. RAC413]